ncbi:MAG: nodulation protein NfeD, partial [Acidimicrobiia bacterium]|nr:nodulation protein NfeD [Acidimicrobiia bacterium]
FFLVAMPTVARSRFSTPTIGRDSLIGRIGTAVTEVAPEGAVEIDGARWRALGHRESGIGAGDSVKVVGIEGIFLQIEPDREN